MNRICRLNRWRHEPTYASTAVPVIDGALPFSCSSQCSSTRQTIDIRASERGVSPLATNWDGAFASCAGLSYVS